MPNATSKNATLLAQSALNLESDFAELQRLSEQIEGITVDTEGGMNHARKLLAKFGECGVRIGEGVQSLSKALDESRMKAEQAAELVAARAVMVQKRQEESDRMNGRFQALVERVHALTVSTAQLKKPEGETLTDDEKSALTSRLTQLDTELEQVITDMRALQADAHQANLKTLEQNADSVAQSMGAARRKLSSVSGPTLKSVPSSQLN